MNKVLSCLFFCYLNFQISVKGEDNITVTTISPTTVLDAATNKTLSAVSEVLSDADINEDTDNVLEDDVTNITSEAGTTDVALEGKSEINTTEPTIINNISTVLNRPINNDYEETLTEIVSEATTSNTEELKPIDTTVETKNANNASVETITYETHDTEITNTNSTSEEVSSDTITEETASNITFESTTESPKFEVKSTSTTSKETTTTYDSELTTKSIVYKEATTNTKPEAAITIAVPTAKTIHTSTEAITTASTAHTSTEETTTVSTPKATTANSSVRTATILAHKTTVTSGTVKQNVPKHRTEATTFETTTLSADLLNTTTAETHTTPSVSDLGVRLYEDLKWTIGEGSDKTMFFVVDNISPYTKNDLKIIKLFLIAIVGTFPINSGRTGSITLFAEKSFRNTKSVEDQICYFFKEIYDITHVSLLKNPNYADSLNLTMKFYKEGLSNQHAVILLLVFGPDESTSENRRSVLNDIKKSNIPVLVVSAYPSPNMPDLQSVASERNNGQGKMLYPLQSISELNELIKAFKSSNHMKKVTPLDCK